MSYPQWIGVFGAIAAFVMMIINFIQGDTVLATMLLVQLTLLFGLLLWWTRRSGAHISHASAQAVSGEGDVIVYWRPGCLYCDRLKFGLGSDRHDVSWVNVLQDAEAAEFVSTYHDGNITVPTAVTGAGEMIDATPAAIKAQLSASS